MFHSEIMRNIFNIGIQPVLIIVIAMVAHKTIKCLINKHYTKLLKKSQDFDFEQRTRTDTIKNILQSVVSIFIVVTTFLLILFKLGIDIRPILATAGVMGVIVGFGAQRFVEDIITGIMLFTEDQIRVGDVVQIGEHSGLVERIGLKMTVLRDISGNVHYIRNGTIKTVINMTRDYSRYVFEIGVAYKENVDAVINLIKEVDEDLRNDEYYGSNILEPIEVLGLDKFTDSAVIIKARNKTKPVKQWEVAREFNRRLKMKFDENNIEMPFPHQILYFEQNKSAETPYFN